MKLNIFISALFITVSFSNNLLSMKFQPMDNTYTGRVKLTLDELTAEERMQDKQLLFARENLIAQEKLKQPVSQMSGKAKTFFYLIFGSFALGTVGMLRKFVRVTDKVFKAKDWISDKAEDIYMTVKEGRVVKVKSDDYKKLVEDINELNLSIREKEHISLTGLQEEIKIKYIKFTDDIKDINLTEKESFAAEVSEYKKSRIFCKSKGFWNTIGVAHESAGNKSIFKRLFFSVTNIPTFYANIAMNTFSDKQFKYIRILKE